MSPPPDRPALTPQLCFSTGTLRQFLRLSRSTLDDSISQNLNALNVPARAGFDPSSTASRDARPNPHLIGAQSCNTFQKNVLFPAWQARTELLDYCALVAASPDPDDPDATLREMENQKQRDKVVNERLDPYSARYFPREARTELLASLIRQERAIEEVVRNRTWDIVRDRCETSSYRWQDAEGIWRREKKK